MLPTHVNSESLQGQCRSKGNISGGTRKCWTREPLGGSCSPRKIWNLEAWKCYFQRSPRAICDLRISRIIYFVHCLSKPMRIESYKTCNVNYKIENQLSLYLETSKCFTFPKQLPDNILFSTFYTGLFLLFRKKNWRGTGPPRPLPLLRHWRAMELTCYSSHDVT